MLGFFHSLITYFFLFILSLSPFSLAGQSNNNCDNLHPTNGGLQVTVYTFTDLQCAFTASIPTIYVASSIVFINEISLTSTNTSFHVVGVSDNITLSVGSTNRLFSLSYTEIAFTSLIFDGERSSAQLTGGLFYASNANLSLYDAVLQNAFGKMGAAVYAQNCLINITSTTVSNNVASDSAILAAVSSQLTVRQSRWVDNVANTGAGGILLEASTASIDHTLFKNNTVSISGGGLSINRNSQASLSDCSFTSNSALLGGGIYVSESSKLSLSSTLFQSNQAIDNGGAIYGIGGAILTATDVEVNNCTAAMGGGVYLSYLSTLTATNLTAKQNTALYSGAIFSLYNQATLNIYNSSFTSNQADQGGVMSVEYYSTVSFVSSTFTGNSAWTYGGTGYVVAQSTINCYDCQFYDNVAIQSGGAIYLQGSTGNFDKTFWQKNVANSGGGVQLVSASLLLSSSTFQENGEFSITQLGGGIYATSSQIQTSSTLMTGNAAKSGGNVVLLSASTLNSHGDEMSSCIGSVGGCIYALGNSTLSFDSLTFHDNYYNPVTSNSSAQVYIDGGRLTLSNSIIEQNSVTETAIFALYSTTTMIENCRIRNNIAYTSAAKGGVFYLASSSTTSGTAQATVRNNSFYANVANNADGGCLYGNAYPGVISIINNSFVGNNASFGGAIASVSVVVNIESSSFINNHAVYGGGAIFWTVVNSVEVVSVDLATCKNESNTAGYGSFYATTLIRLSASFPTSYQVSGNSLSSPIFIYLIDYYGQIVTTPALGQSVRPNIYASIYNNSGLIEGSTIVTATNGVASFREIIITGIPGHTTYLQFNAPLSSISAVVVGIHFRSCVGGEITQYSMSSSQWSSCYECTLGTYSFNPSDTECHVCPDHASCPGGAIIDVDSDYWRYDENSDTIYQCRATGVCDGGTNTSTQCSTGQSGPYCSVCEDGYTQDQNGVCYSCNSGTDSAAETVATVLFVLLVVLLGLMIRYRVKIIQWYNALATKFDGWFTKLSTNRKFHTIRVKAKIVVAFCQIVYAVGPALSVVFPVNYTGFLGYYSAVQLNPIKLPNLGCVVQTNFYDELLVVTISPFVIFFCVAVGIQFMAWYAKRLNERNPWYTMKRAKQDTINAAFAISYFVLVSASTKIFQVFDCQSFDDGSAYLVADYSIDCNAPDRSRYVTYGIFMIFIYPIGIPLAYAIVLFRNRKYINPDWRHVIDATEKKFVSNRVIQKEKIKIRKTYEEIANIKLLYDSYVPKRWYFELFDCARRLLLGAIPVLVLPGSTLQVIIVLLISLVSVATFMHFSPYIHVHDNNLAVMAQWSITLVLISALIIKVEAMSSSENYEGLGVVLVIINITIFVTAVLMIIMRSKEKKLPDENKKKEGEEGEGEGDEEGSSSSDESKDGDPLPAIGRNPAFNPNPNITPRRNDDSSDSDDEDEEEEQSVIDSDEDEEEVAAAKQANAPTAGRRDGKGTSNSNDIELQAYSGPGRGGGGGGGGQQPGSVYVSNPLLRAAAGRGRNDANGGSAAQP